MPARQPTNLSQVYKIHCGIGLARDGGLPTDQPLAGVQISLVGTGLPAMPARQPINLSQVYKMHL
jgi:hypothetical protein